MDYELFKLVLYCNRTPLGWLSCSSSNDSEVEEVRKSPERKEKTSPMTSRDSDKLDKQLYSILDSLAEGIQHLPKNDAQNYTEWVQATYDKLLKHYISKQDIEEAIGEEEDHGEFPDSDKYPPSTYGVVTDGRNQLRAEIRTKLNLGDENK